MKKLKIILITGITFLVISAAFLLYPTLSNFINSWFSSQTILSYNRNADTLSDDAIEKELKAAKNYNDKLTNRVSASYSTKAVVDGYDDILDFDGIIGSIEIPEIDVNLPIYHGSDEAVLTKGVAHLPNTSFPIGGIGCHAVLSAHTAYPTQVFFDNLTELEKGDVILINILNKVFEYKVIESNIVKPEDTTLLEIVEDKDLISLVTCYPYGINSHRLIVTAERVEEGKEVREEIKTGSGLISSQWLWFVLPLPFILFAIVTLILKYRINKKI